MKNVKYQTNEIKNAFKNLKEVQRVKNKV
jgi:hypothetical protein